MPRGNQHHHRQHGQYSHRRDRPGDGDSHGPASPAGDRPRNRQRCPDGCDGDHPGSVESEHRPSQDGQNAAKLVNHRNGYEAQRADQQQRKHQGQAGEPSGQLPVNRGVHRLGPTLDLRRQVVARKQTQRRHPYPGRAQCEHRRREGPSRRPPPAQQARDAQTKRRCACHRGNRVERYRVDRGARPGRSDQRPGQRRAHPPDVRTLPRRGRGRVPVGFVFDQCGHHQPGQQHDHARCTDGKGFPSQGGLDGCAFIQLAQPVGCEAHPGPRQHGAQPQRPGRRGENQDLADPADRPAAHRDQGRRHEQQRQQQGPPAGLHRQQPAVLAKQAVAHALGDLVCQVNLPQVKPRPLAQRTVSLAQQRQRRQAGQDQHHDPADDENGPLRLAHRMPLSGFAERVSRARG